MQSLEKKHIILYIYYQNLKLFGYYLKFRHELKKQGTPRKLKKILEISLSTAEKLYNPNHIEIARIFKDLGSVCRDLGEWKEAIVYLEAALAIYSPLNPDGSKDISWINNQLGAIAWERNNLRDAKIYFKKALLFDKKYFPGNSDEVARDYLNIGIIEKEQGNKREAYNLFLKALRIQIKLENDDKIGLICGNLCSLLREMNRISEAEDYGYKSLSSLKQYFKDENHPKIAMTLNYLGLCRYDLGDYEKAIDYHNSALNIYNRAYGHYHSRIANTYTYLGKAHIKNDNKFKGKNYLLGAIEIYTKLSVNGDQNINIEIIQKIINSFNN